MEDKKYKYCQCSGPTQNEVYGKICAFCFKQKHKQDQSQMATKIEEVKKKTKLVAKVNAVELSKRLMPQEIQPDNSIGLALKKAFENFLGDPVFFYQGQDAKRDEWSDSDGKNKLTRTPRN